MPEHEILACVLFLFQVLFRIEGMKDAIKVDMGVSLHQPHTSVASLTLELQT